MRRFRFLVLATAAAGGVLLGPAPAGAHALHADLVVAAEVRLVAYFDDDLPADGAAAVVTDGAGAEVLSGRTDGRGVWTFPRPRPGAYALTVKSVGHAARVEFVVADEPDAPAVAFAGPRRNQALGLAAGAGGLLVLSAAFWFVRRRRVQ
jgi:hypothetical protein